MLSVQSVNGFSIPRSLTKLNMFGYWYQKPFIPASMAYLPSRRYPWDNPPTFFAASSNVTS